MSITSIVNQFSVEFHIYRPTLTLSQDGKTMRTYALYASYYGFIQPSGQTSDVFEASASGRTACTIYFAGAVDVRIDDELYSAKTGSVDRWRVVGMTNPGEVARTAAPAHRLNMTVVEAVQIDPQISL